MDGTGITEAHGGIDIDDDNNPKYLRDQTLQNWCTATWKAGYIYIQGAGLFLNAGLFDIKCDRKMLKDASTTGQAAFWNADTVVKTQGSGESLFQVKFENRGNVAVQSGFVRLQAGSNRGALSVVAGSTLYLEALTYTLDAGTNISGAGTVWIVNGSLIIDS